MKDKIKKLFDGTVEITHVGSRVTCNPAPTDTDDDWLVLIDNHNRMSEIDAKLKEAGFEIGGSVFRSGSRNEQDFFWSYTKGELNLIIVGTVDFYIKFIHSTKLCTKLNLLNKEDRITLFQYILYGNLI